ncbi:MAG: hypothetical protein COA99_13620 [Moraxellaceae bacterium]|nr:MAG: hypothetical protein COA99_13620 [Moraxellaceae bacterium]
MSVGSKIWGVYNDIDRGLDKSNVNMHVWGNHKSIHSSNQKHSDNGMLKSLAKGTAMVGSSALTIGTKTPGLTALAVTAATGGTIALSATGIGAVAVAGAYAVGNSVLAGVSVYKTHNHISNLEDLLHKGNHKCDGNRWDHGALLMTVLPYIINKKKTKLRRKSEETVPVLGGMFTTAETGMKSIFKRLSGTRGVARHHNAEILTKHLVTCNCGLAEGIVGELCGTLEMGNIRAMDSNEAGYWIFNKMASM